LGADLERLQDVLAAARRSDFTAGGSEEFTRRPWFCLALTTPQRSVWTHLLIQPFERQAIARANRVKIGVTECASRLRMT